MKKIILFLLHLCIITSLAPCQNKTESAPYTFSFDEKPYSYKNYEIIPGTSYTNYFPMAVGETEALLYSKGTYTFMDSLTLIDIVDIKSENNKYAQYGLLFSQNVYLQYISDMRFLIKGLQKYNHSFVSLSDMPRGMEFSEEGKIIRLNLNNSIYTLTKEYENDENDKVNDFSMTLSDGSTTQCFFKAPPHGNLFHNFEIYMCGDFDGDKKLDMIVKVFDSSNSDSGIVPIYYLLYLSSEAQEGELLKHVATHVFKQDRTFYSTETTFKK